MNQKKAIRIEVSYDEHELLVNQAKTEKCTLKYLVTRKILDNSMGVQQLSDKIIKEMPIFYDLLLQIEDEHVRTELQKVGEKICQFLK